MLKWPSALRRQHLSRRQRIFLGGVSLTIIICLSVWLIVRDKQSDIDANNGGSTYLEVQEPLVTNDIEPKQVQSPPPQTVEPPFLFGVGTELDQAINHRITKESRIKLITSWFNGTKDLGFMNSWRNSAVPKAYASGYAQHLIIYSNDTEQDLTTAYGPACGRPYPLSKQFLVDVEQLAQNFKGGELYVSMFTELQTYPCNDNNWSGSQNYYQALKDQYMTAMNIFHKTAPGSKVSLSWGGWQANWDDAGKGGGRTLFKHFEDVMNASDFQSFQAMANTGNLEIMTNMTKALNPYSGGVMVSHYKPDSGNQNAFESDIKEIFTPKNMATFQENGLFAFSFMDSANMNSSESTYQSVKKVVQEYSR